MSENNTELQTGSINYANEVIATIASVATAEVDGIAGIAGVTALNAQLSKGKIPRGVRVELKDSDVSVDIRVRVDYGSPIQKVGRNVQENVRKSIESMTGLHVERVDLHVVGVNFEKEDAELRQSQQLANVVLDDEKSTVAEIAEAAEEAEEQNVSVVFDSEAVSASEEDETEDETEASEAAEAEAQDEKDEDEE